MGAVPSIAVRIGRWGGDGTRAGMAADETGQPDAVFGVHHSKNLPLHDVQRDELEPY